MDALGTALLMVIFYITSGVITVGNVLILIAAIVRPTIRNVRSNLYIVSLALTDLIVGAIVTPLNIKYHQDDRHWYYPKWACQAWIYFDTVACTASIWNLVAIAADRWLAVHKPVVYMGLNKWKVVLIIVGVWIVSMLICLPSLLNFDDYFFHQRYCQIRQSEFVIWWSFTMSYSLPTLLIILFYVSILVQLRKKTAKKKQMMIPKMNDIELDDLEDEKAEENDQVLEQSSANAWIKVRMWIRQRSYAGSSMESGDPNCCNSRKTSSTHLSPDLSTLASPPSPRPKSPLSDEILVQETKKEATDDDVHDQVPESALGKKVSFSTEKPILIRGLKTKRKPKKNALSKSPSAVAASEKREKKVLIQMSVLVLAFLLFWSPFWIFYFTLMNCHLLYGEKCGIISRQGTGTTELVLQVLGYSNSLINPFLYTAFNREFRLAFADIFTCKILNCVKR